MKYILTAFIFVSQNLYAQQGGNGDKYIAESILKTIQFLADDKLEGRRTGSGGEKIAYEFIISEFKKAGLSPFIKDNTYLQPFDVFEGRMIGKETALNIEGQVAELYADFFPLPFSSNVNNFIFNRESTDVVYYDLIPVIKENENNPHFDLKENVLNFAKTAQEDGKKLVVVKSFSESKSVNPAKLPEEEKKVLLQKQRENFKALFFDENDKTPSLNIPIIYTISHPPEDKPQVAMGGEVLPTSSLTVNLEVKKLTGHNVIGYINNKAAGTIILGAHYDHLGYGDAHNSLYAGSTPMIHNGADDNASGTAALIELGKWLKNSPFKKYNFVLVAFSGEELGLYGSKYFIDHSGIDMISVNYMINMDMIGRLNDSTHGLTIGGYGTSPSWGKIIPMNDPYFKIHTDSSGSGPSDHTSFYRKDIPVLFFFTGSHKDYHKPSDDADKINYTGEVKIIEFIENIIVETDKADKLVFQKTRDNSPEKMGFKVSLGIMPDYTFTGAGVMVDAVSENKPAQKAGIHTGDVLIKLGEHVFSDVQGYMDALNKFNKGESSVVTLKRGAEIIVLPVIF